jgi:hypothetical protein
MNLKMRLKRVLGRMDLERKLDIAVRVLMVLEWLLCQYRTGVEGVRTYGYLHLLDPVVAL